MLKVSQDTYCSTVVVNRVVECSRYVFHNYVKTKELFSVTKILKQGVTQDGFKTF